jgi:hypothetical protein
VENNALDFGNGSWDQAKGLIFSTLRAHDSDIEGNGKDGLKLTVSKIDGRVAAMETAAKTTVFWARLIGWFVVVGIPTIALIVANKK